MKLNFNQMFSDKKALKLMSLLAAFVLWYTVANSVSDSRTFTISDVPVSFDNLSSSAMARLGLEAVAADDVTVDVEVQGKRYIIGNLTTNDIKVTPDITKVQGAGTYPITLSGADANGLGFEVVGITPSTVSVRFDRFASKKLPIETEILGISTTEGYLIENEIVSPNEVVITGPESDIALISRCVARVQIDRVLRDSYSTETDLLLLDQDGNPVDSSDVSMSVESAQITVPILKTKELPLTVDYINLPQNFNIEDLSFTFSKETLKLAGPAASIDKMEKLSLGNMDIRNLSPNSVFDFEVELPAGFVNIENIQMVQVAFEPEDYTGIRLNLTDIQPVNVPSGYKVEVETLQLNNVEIIGPSAVIGTLSSGDLTAVVDLSERAVSEGEYTLDVKIYSPEGLPVWAKGKYEAIVLVTEAEENE